MKRTKLDIDNFEGPPNATNRQVAVLVDEIVGGWPAKAGWLMMFRHKVTEWVVTPGEPPRLMSPEEYEVAKKNLKATFKFTDVNGITLDETRKLERPDWEPKLGRDEYYLMRMSPAFAQGLINQGREEERRRIQKLLDLK